MTSLDVYFKPLRALEPFHLAVVGTLGNSKTLHGLRSGMPLPPALLDATINDLLDWKLLEHNGRDYCLTETGNRCLLVWLHTNRRGYWSFPSPEDWLLGPGTFSFRAPLSRLEDAMCDFELGEKMTFGDAVQEVRDFDSQRDLAEQEILSRAVVQKLSEGITGGSDLIKILEEQLSRSGTFRQSILFSEQAQAFLSESLNHSPNSLNPTTAAAIQEAQEKLSRLPNNLRWKFTKAERTFQFARRVLLADWLGKRDGLLKSLAEDIPSSLLVVSNCQESPNASEESRDGDAEDD